MTRKVKPTTFALPDIPHPTRAEVEHLNAMTGGRRRCYFADIADTPCDGRLIRAHLIPQQVLRRECGRAWRRLSLDPRCWVWCCGGVTGIGGHHGALDVARTLRPMRDELPPDLEVFAAEVGLTWWLERSYGPRKGTPRPAAPGTEQEG